MAARSVNRDRQTPMFLPCDLCDWMPADHLVHFILEHIATAPFHLNHRGTGRAHYPPTLMLALLILLLRHRSLWLEHHRSGAAT